MIDVQLITSQVSEAVQGLLDVAGLKPGNILVVGCSTSEVRGEKIGKGSNMEVAEAILNGILPLVNKNNLFLAVQCCEHLNRALVVEARCAAEYGLEIVLVIPHATAGGSCAAEAYNRCEQPVCVETITGHAGIDIGDTFIGMHLKRVAVPVRLSIKQIGQAHLTLARVRPKFVGGERAKYTRV